MTTAMLDGHMDLVRSEYEATKADHAHEDGCDNCTRGLNPANILGWDYDLDANELLCPECAYERKRHKLQVKAASRRATHCRNNHEITGENVYYEARQPYVAKCLECRRERSRRGHLKRQAEKAAARNGGAA